MIFGNKTLTKLLLAILFCFCLFDTTLMAQNNDVLAKSYYGKAQENYGNGNNQQALKYLVQALGYLNNKTNPRIESLYTQIYNSERDYIEAEKHIDIYFRDATSGSPDYDKMMSLLVDIKEAANQEKAKAKALEENRKQEELLAKKRAKEEASRKARLAKRRKEIEGTINKINSLITKEEFDEANKLIESIESEEAFNFKEDIKDIKALECYNSYKVYQKNVSDFDGVVSFIESSTCKEEYTNELKTTISPSLIEKADNLYSSNNLSDLTKSKKLYNTYLDYVPKGEKVNYAKSQIKAIENKLMGIEQKELAGQKKQERESNKRNDLAVWSFNFSGRHVGINHHLIFKKLGINIGFKFGGLLNDNTFGDDDIVIDENERLALTDEGALDAVISAGSSSATVRSSGATSTYNALDDKFTESYAGVFGLNYQIAPSILIYSDFSFGYFATYNNYNESTNFGNGFRNPEEVWIKYESAGFGIATEIGVGFLLSNLYLNGGILFYPERSPSISVGIGIGINQ